MHVFFSTFSLNKSSVELFSRADLSIYSSSHKMFLIDFTEDISLNIYL